MRTEAEVVVVGGGPAGMSAAIAAADAGCDVLLVDESADLGGQIFKAIPFAVTDPASLGKDQARRAELHAAVLRRPRIETLLGASVWGVFPERVLAVSNDDGARTIRAKALVLATGAQDRVVPFPGCTLPGVITAGAALTLIKSQRILPGHRVLLAGTGPIQLVLAKALLEGGAHVVAVLDGSRRAAWRELPSLAASPALVREGIGYLTWLRRRKIRVQRGRTIVAAEGDGRLRTATIARVDNRWAPLAGTEYACDVDCVITSFGFVPATELSRMSGCRHEFREALGGWVPRVSEEMETSEPRIFAAGETTGVAGAVVAGAEGTLAGIGAARSVGRVAKAAAAELARDPLRRLRKLYRFRAGIDRLYVLGPGLAQIATPDTIVCRCEDVDASHLRAAIAAGARSLQAIKLATRAGMGPCQGRMCLPSIALALAQQRGVPPGDAPWPTARPPIKPTSLARLI